MKQIITYLAIITILIVILTFTSDYGRASIASFTVKQDATSTANTIASFYDSEEYSKGYYVFDYSVITTIADDALSNKGYSYTIYTFDPANKIMKCYKPDDTGLCSLSYNSSVLYPYEFTEKNGSTYEITNPTVVVQISKEVDIFRLSEIDTKKIKRSAMVTVKARI